MASSCLPCVFLAGIGNLLFNGGISLINTPVFSLADSPFRRKMESAIQSSLVDTNSSQNSSGEH